MARFEPGQLFSLNTISFCSLVAHYENYRKTCGRLTVEVQSCTYGRAVKMFSWHSLALSVSYTHVQILRSIQLVLKSAEGKTGSG